MPMPGTGLVLQVTDVSPIVTIGQVASIEGWDGVSYETIPIPAVDEAHRRMISSGKYEYPEVSIEVAWDPSNASYAEITTMQTTSRTFSLTLTDSGATVRTCVAFLKSVSPSIRDAELGTATIVLQPTSATGAASPYA